MAWAAPLAAQATLRPDPLGYVAPSRDFDVIHTVVDLDLNLEDQTVTGAVTHSLEVLTPGVSEIHLNCVDLTIDRVTIDGAEVDYEYPVDAPHSTSWIEVADQRQSSVELVVHAAQSLARGETVELRIEYHGAPKAGLYFIAPEKGIKEKRYEVWSQGEGEDNRYWIPCFDYPYDKATYEGIFRVKRGYYCLSNGVLAERKDIGDQTQFHWRLETPQSAYLIMVAAGDYEIVEEKWQDVPLMYLVPPGTGRETTLRSYGRTKDIMDFFATRTGLGYPFKKYAQVTVQNFIYGGMENTTATVMTSDILYDEGIALTQTRDWLVAHELAHMWWGDMVTCTEWSQLWLNEGFATYWQSLFRENYEGDDALRFEMADRHRRVVERDDKDARPVVVDFFNRKDARNSANVYIKGSSVLHMLRFLIGDELFFETFENYGRERQYKNADTRDFMRAVRETTGQNLDWFFEQWIYLAGHPKLKVTKSWDADNGMLTLNVQQTQKVEGLWPLFRLPVDVEITCEGVAHTYRIVVDQASADFTFSCPSAPDMVIFDKGDWTLKTLDFPKPTHELIYQLENGDIMARARAARALGEKRNDGGAVGALAKVLTSQASWELRREAALALGELGGDDARGKLLAALTADEARVRLAVAEALGRHQAHDDIDEALLKTLRTDAAWEVRAQAVKSLVKMESPVARKACLEALKQDVGNLGHHLVRVAGIEGIADLKATDLIDKIEPFTGPGNRRGYRHAAITSYAKLAKELRDERDRRQASEHLAAMLDDWYVKTRTTVISALQTLADESAVDPLREVARNDPVVTIRQRASRAANAIETKTEAVAKSEEMQTDIKELKDQIQHLQQQLGDLQARVPREPSRDDGNDERLSSKGGKQ